MCRMFKICAYETYPNIAHLQRVLALRMCKEFWLCACVEHFSIAHTHRVLAMRKRRELKSKYANLFIKFSHFDVFKKNQSRIYNEPTNFQRKIETAAIKLKINITYVKLNRTNISKRRYSFPISKRFQINIHKIPV